MARKSSNDKWAEYNRNILEALDIRAEYAALGVQFTETEPNHNGWIQCRAIGREDANPSAGVNVGLGPSHGRYKDFGGNGECLGLFDFAAKYGTAADWKDARAIYAAKTNVRKPRVEEDSPRDVFGPMSSPSAGRCAMFMAAKPGFSIDSIYRTGGMDAVYSYKLPPSMRQDVLLWRMYGPGGMEAEPTGYHATRPDGQQIAIHNRNKNTPDYSKTLTKGQVGLMNEWTMRHFREATVIWLVEGLTDMLTLQTLLGNNTDHLVTTLGGASARTPGAIEIFEGKQVMICYDADEAGDEGSMANAARLCGIATVKVVKLPTRGMDLRDFVNAGHNYHDLWALTEQVEVLLPSSQEVVESVKKEDNSILSKAGVGVLGIENKTGKILLWNKKINELNMVTMGQLRNFYEAAIYFDPDMLYQNFAERPAEDSGKLAYSEVKAAISSFAVRAQRIDMDLAMGVGCWQVDDSIVLVNGTKADIYRPSDELEVIDEPVVGDRLIELPGKEFNWYDRDLLISCLSMADDREWREAAFAEITDLFLQFDNFSKPTDAQVLAALVCATFLESIWPIRPHIGITGWTNTGKSTLVEQFLKPIFGNLGIAMVAPTEPAVRQASALGCNVVLVDEFDTAADQAKILEMARASSRKQVKVKGSVLGRPQKFTLQHMMYFSGLAIDRYFHRIVDRNRFVFLELQPFPNDKPTKPTPPHKALANQIRHKMLAIALRGYSEIMNIIQLIENTPFIEGRLPQVYALPVAVLSYAHEWSMEDSSYFMRGLLGGIQEDIEETIIASDPTYGTLQAILLHGVRLPRGMMTSVEELIVRGSVADYDHTPYSHSITEAYGIRRYTPRYGDDHFASNELADRIFINTDMVCKTILKGRELKPLALRKVLMKVPTARSHSFELNGTIKRGVSIDMNSLLMACGNSRHGSDSQGGEEEDNSPF